MQKGTILYTVSASPNFIFTDNIIFYTQIAYSIFAKPDIQDPCYVHEIELARDLNENEYVKLIQYGIASDSGEIVKYHLPRGIRYPNFITSYRIMGDHSVYYRFTYDFSHDDIVNIFNQMSTIHINDTLITFGRSLNEALMDMKKSRIMKIRKNPKFDPKHQIYTDVIIKI